MSDIEMTKQEIQEKRSAIIELEEIQMQIDELSNTAENLVRQNFESEISWCEAYQIFAFSGVNNPYEDNFNKLIENLKKEWYNE